MEEVTLGCSDLFLFHFLHLTEVQSRPINLEMIPLLVKGLMPAERVTALKTNMCFYDGQQNFHAC